MSPDMRTHGQCAEIDEFAILISHSDTTTEWRISRKARCLRSNRLRDVDNLPVIHHLSFYRFIQAEIKICLYMIELIFNSRRILDPHLPKEFHHDFRKIARIITSRRLN